MFHRSNGLLSLILCSLIVGLSAVPHLPGGDGYTVDEENLSFHYFKSKFGKQYANAQEEALRYVRFKSNLRIINEHNAAFKAGATSFWMEMNSLTDLSDQEYRALLGYKPKPNLRSAPDTTSCTHQDVTVPASVDWREVGAVTPVKDQGQCGSCWTFSATGAIEGAWFIATNQLLQLSEEEILQCDRDNGDQGCDGGDPDSAFRWVITNGGLATEAEYPYSSGATGATGNCSAARRLRFKDARISAVCDVAAGDEGDLAKAVAQQPVAVGVEADQKAFQFYAGGVLPAGKCGAKLDHGVLAVGFGHDAELGLDYWIVKNSWSDAWGEDGYIRIEKAPPAGKHSACGIALAASYPIV